MSASLPPLKSCPIARQPPRVSSLALSQKSSHARLYSGAIALHSSHEVLIAPHCSTSLGFCPSRLLCRSNPCPSLRADLPAFLTLGGGGGFGDVGPLEPCCGGAIAVQQHSSLFKSGNLCINSLNNLCCVHGRDYSLRSRSLLNWQSRKCCWTDCLLCKPADTGDGAAHGTGAQRPSLLRLVIRQAVWRTATGLVCSVKAPLFKQSVVRCACTLRGCAGGDGGELSCKRLAPHRVNPVKHFALNS